MARSTPASAPTMALLPARALEGRLVARDVGQQQAGGHDREHADREHHEDDGAEPPPRRRTDEKLPPKAEGRKQGRDESPRHSLAAPQWQAQDGLHLFLAQTSGRASERHSPSLRLAALQLPVRRFGGRLPSTFSVNEVFAADEGDIVEGDLGAGRGGGERFEDGVKRDGVAHRAARRSAGSGVTVGNAVMPEAMHDRRGRT